MNNTVNQHKFFVNILIGLFFCVAAMVNAQTNSAGQLPQYLLSDFNKAQVLLKNGQSLSVMMNYNIVTERMVYEKEGNYYDLLNPETIDTIIILNMKFTIIGKKYYELMYKGMPLTLFIQHKGELASAGTPAAYGGTSQVAATKSLSSIELSGGRYNLPLPSEYIVTTTTVYWIRRQDEMFNFLNEKQFLKLFPDKELELKKFIKANRIKIDKPEQLTKLVTYCNELIR
jgi:hypothetical protein